jgi:hypothetical protein
MNIRHLALQAAIAGIVTGMGASAANAMDYVQKDSRTLGEKDSCSGANGCGGKKTKKDKDKHGCNGPNGCSAKKDDKEKDTCSGPNGCGSKK